MESFPEQGTVPLAGKFTFLMKDIQECDKQRQRFSFFHFRRERIFKKMAVME